VIKIVDQVLNVAARSAGVLCLLLVLLTTEQVIARYFFNASSVGAQELEWHLFGMIFLLAAAPALLKGEHVRVDIFYSRFAPAWRRRINLAGHVLLLIPTASVLVWYGAQSVLQARTYGVSGARTSDWLEFLLAGEGSPDPGGLPARWIIKAFVPLCGMLLILAALRDIVAMLKKDADGT
jgi:TRAP-type mannitol/chloroaromatic compound transport system permease small subunit